MLSTLGHFAAYAIGGEVTYRALKTIIPRTLGAGFRLVSRARSHGAGLRALLDHVRKTRSFDNAREIYLREKASVFRAIDFRSRQAQQRFQEMLVSGYKRRLNVVARAVGGKKAFSRKIVRDAINMEGRFLPINYIMYKMDQHTGAIPKDQSFLSYYATTGLPLGLSFSAGFDIARRAARVGKIKAFYANRAATFGFEAATKFGFEALHNLNKMTAGMYAVYDHTVSKFLRASAVYGSFRGTLAAIREIGHSAHNVSLRKARRSDLLIHKSIIKDFPVAERSIHFAPYMEVKGDIRAAEAWANRNRLERDPATLNIWKESYDTGQTNPREEGELLRRGISKKFAAVHRRLRTLAGDKNYGDDIGYVTKKIPVTMEELRAGKTGDFLVRIQRYVTRDRRHIEFLGREYNIGSFHIDSIKDSMNKIVTQVFNIANRPWLNFLDGGNNWLMSKQTKILQYGIRKGIGVVGAGLKYTTSVKIAESQGDPVIEDLIRSGNFTEAAIRGIRNMFGLDKNMSDKEARNMAMTYLKSKQRRAYEAVKLTNPAATKEQVEQEVVTRLAVQMRDAELEFGKGDVIDITSGVLKLHTNIEGVGTTTFTVHHLGEEIRASTLLRGDTRAGQLAANILGGAKKEEINGLTITTGIETTMNVKMSEYYNKSASKFARLFAKFGTALEIGGGAESSVLGIIASIYKKWNDPRYIGSTMEQIRSGRLTLDELKYKLKNNTADTKDVIDMIKAVQSDANRSVRELYAAVRAVSEANASKGIDMSSIFARITQALAESKSASKTYAGFLKEFDPEKMIINRNDSVALMKKKTRAAIDFHEKVEKSANELGFTPTKLIELDEVLGRAQTGSGHSALNPTLKSGVDAADQYNRNVFEALLSIAATDKEAAVNVSRILAEVAHSARQVGKRGQFRKLETTTSGIYNTIMLNKSTNDFLGKDKIQIMTERQANEMATLIYDRANHYDKFGLFDVLKPFGGKKRLKESPSAENKFIVVAENELKGIDTGNFRVSPIRSGEIAVLAAVNTMNSALSYIGMGFDIGNRTVDMQSIISKVITKRVLLFAAGFAAHDFITTGIQNTPFLRDTSLAGGISGLAWDAYAGARVLSQTVSDVTGITDAARYMEDLMPGSIDSPLSGFIRGVVPIALGMKIGSFSRMGAFRGGLIGTSVGVILGGGPLGIFGDWNIAKGREEVIKELTGEKEVEVRKGRFWELSSGYFLGNKTSYFRPHMYALQKARYQRGSNYIGNDPFEQLVSYVDPSVYARKHYLTRPYPVSYGLLSNLPILGGIAGELGGPAYMHEDFLGEMADSALLRSRTALPGSTSVQGAPGESVQSTGSYYGGSIVGGASRNLTVPEEGFGTVVDETADNILDIAGLRGFLVGSAISGTFGSATGFGGGVRLESANSIASVSKMYWEKELGGIIGMSEGIRRILPNPSTGGVEYWNEIPNIMPNWLPGKDSFIDFQVGDAYNKVQYGEVRLPGESYELMKNVFYTYPIDSSMMRRPYEEQVGFYAGDVITLTEMKRRWYYVERTRKELVGELKKHMEIEKEKDVAYDPDNDVHAYVDAISKDATGKKMAILIAPITAEGLDPAAEAQLNAFLVNNTKEIQDGLLIGLDKDGNTTKMLVRRDIKRYIEDVKNARKAALAGAKLTAELQKEGESVNRWPAYSHINRLEILLNISPFSQEAQLQMKIVQKQKEAGRLSQKQIEKYNEIMQQFVKRLNALDTKEYRFLPILLGKTPLGEEARKRMAETMEKYSEIERYLGGIYEYISHIRSPITNKLLGNRSIYEAYREDVAIGKSFKSWNDPITDYIETPLDMLASEEDPIQAAISGATGGFLFGGPIGAGIGSAVAAVSAMTGATRNERGDRWKELDQVQVLADIIKYKEIQDIDSSQVGTERRITIRKKQSAYYNYTQGYQEGPSGVNDIVGALSPAERYYVKRILRNIYKEDVEQFRNLLPEYARPMLDSYVNQTPLDTSAYSEYLSQASKIVNGAPLQFRSDDLVYKIMQDKGLQATDLSIGWKQQVNRVKYMEAAGMEIPNITEDQNYPGIIPRFGGLR